jgi:polysaccharide export outer membrane protein
MKCEHPAARKQRPLRSSFGKEVAQSPMQLENLVKGGVEMIRKYWLLKGFAVALLALAGIAPAQSTESAKQKKDSKQAKNVAALKAEPTMAASDTKTSSTDLTAARRDLFSEYKIGEQDVLTITVWRETELSGTVMVRPDGKITLPLLNDVHAAGLTPDELKNSLTEKLGPFVNTPQVTVAVREINSRKVFIIGQVGHEGSYRINSTTTVLQIIAEAGGLRDFANRKGIYVLRTQNGSQQRLTFNYDKVIRGKDSKDNILLRPGDTIVVP